MKLSMLKLVLAATGLLTIACSGGGVFVGSDQEPTKSEDTGVTVGSRGGELTVALARDSESAPIEPTDASIVDTVLTLHLTSYGTLDGGTGNCDESTLVGAYSGTGETLEMSYTQNAALPAIEQAPENLCGLYVTLEPRASSVTSGAVPSVAVEIRLSDGRAIHFESNDHLFLVAALGSLDPATVTFALDPLAWFADIDLAALSYATDQTSLLTRESQPNLYAAILANISLDLVSSDNQVQEP